VGAVLSRGGSEEADDGDPSVSIGAWLDTWDEIESVESDDGGNH